MRRDQIVHKGESTGPHETKDHGRIPAYTRLKEGGPWTGDSGQQMGKKSTTKTTKRNDPGGSLLKEKKRRLT